MIGDRRKYLTCLIMIDQENVEKFAQDQKIPFSDFASLCAAPEVVALIRQEVETVNREFARVEQIKDFRLINVLLTAEDEELTATIRATLAEIQDNLFTKAVQYREALTTSVDSYDEFLETLETKGGFVLAHWDGTAETESRIKNETKATIRCIPLDQPEEPGVDMVTGKPSTRRVVFARAY